MASPPISVVMSVFNGQAYLAEAVESILNQTFRDFTFIIIDDGSTDKTAETLAHYAKLDPRIRIISHANKGRAVSLNIGIEAAKSEYIARMDADDVALPERFQREFDFLESHPNVGILGGAVEVVSANGRPLRRITPETGDAEIRSTMPTGNPMWHPTILMRRQHVIAAGGYRKQFLDTDDYDLWLRMIERCQIANLEDCVLRYRIHANQVSLRNMRHQVMCGFAARTAARCRQEGKPDPFGDIAEITPSLLEALGLSAQEIHQKSVATCTYWLSLFIGTDEDAALQTISELQALSSEAFVPHEILCEAWLTAARIHHRRGNIAKGLACALRAITARPIVAGRPVKRAFQRLTRAVGH